LQPIARDLLCDRAYWEQLKRNASPRTFLEFVRFAFAADLEGKTGGGGNAQVIIQAPFPRGPLDVLPAHMRIEAILLPCLLLLSTWLVASADAFV
jgi:hypothetical protein